MKMTLEEQQRLDELAERDQIDYENATALDIAVADGLDKYEWDAWVNLGAYNAALARQSGCFKEKRNEG